MPKAYSYLRFSTTEQRKGDSTRRQSDAARNYAKLHGLEFDESLTFKDLGVSAFRGKNAQEGGALAAFLSAVENGKVAEGSYLLVEHLDRLSRDKVRAAYNRFSSILEAGVNIVTLQDGKLYTADSMNENFSDLIISLAQMYNAHEASATKSKRVGAAWKSKRDKAQADSKVKLTAKCPGWLSLNSDREGFTVDTKRKKIVKRIFELALAGHGKTYIMRKFNSEGVPTFGKSQAWHANVIQQILESEAVCGVFQPMRVEVTNGKKKRVPDGEPIPGYYPVVIDRATFERVRRSRAAKHIPPGRKGNEYANLFTGLMVCGSCGAPIYYASKSLRHRYLTCSNAKGGGTCRAASWQYIPTEVTLLGLLLTMDVDSLYPEIARNGRDAVKALEDSKLEAQDALAKANRQLANLVDALAENPAQPTIQSRLNTTQATADNLTVTIQNIDSQIAEARERVETNDLSAVQDAIARMGENLRANNNDRYDLRSRLHQLFKRTLDKIVLTTGTKHQRTIAAHFQGSEKVRTVEVEF